MARRKTIQVTLMFGVLLAMPIVGRAQAYPYKSLDSIFGEIRFDLVGGGKAPTSEELLKMAFTQPGDRNFELETGSGKLTILFAGQGNKIVVMGWNPKDGLSIPSHVLSSLISRSASLQIFSHEKFKVIVSESNTPLGSRARESLTIGLDGKLYATLIEAFLP